MTVQEFIDELLKVARPEDRILLCDGTVPRITITETVGESRTNHTITIACDACE